MAGDSDVKRKRQLSLLGVAGIAVIVLALAGSFFPVHASFQGEPSYNCGSPFHRWRNPNAVKSQWGKDSMIIGAAYPRTRITQKTPLPVCQDRVQSRMTIIKAVIVLAVLMIAAAFGLYWHLFGFVYDPHV